eukprot:Skav212077  [mRNA]  locus=scaffold867:122935:123827:- [translate_table: standard]
MFLQGSQREDSGQSSAHAQASAGASLEAMDDFLMVSKDWSRISASPVGRSLAMDATNRPAKLAKSLVESCTQPSRSARKDAQQA